MAASLRSQTAAAGGQSEAGAAATGRVPGPNRALAWASALLMAVSLYLVFIYAPIERTQGVPQKIFYFHVPLAWDAYLAFFLTLVGSVAYLRTRKAGWDILARASAEIGVVFTTLVLITGSIWGKTIWGTWWTWDARLTSTLVMWFIYVAYMMLRSYLGQTDRSARYAAILGIVGFIDVPIVHMSVTWWRTLHPQPTIANPAGPTLPGSMLLAFFVCLITFTVFFVYVLRERLMIERLRDEVHSLTDSLLESAV
ncbi:MAG: cytochrome c biogenesis protein CcsA [Chloroflexota bacterium]|nr:cytochrome c biogenesis protein CcsA [Chloroflexota bacterium]